MILTTKTISYSQQPLSSGSKIRVYCRDTTYLYLAFILSNYLKIDLTIIEFLLIY